MGLFGKKIVCFECNKKAKAKISVYRRHMRFCSQTCLQTHVTANPVRPAPGTDAAAHTQEAKIRLESALAALVAAGGKRSLDMSFGAVAGAMLAAQAHEESIAALHQFDQFVLEALPFLYALGKGALAEQLETIDLGPLQDTNKSVANALEPIVARVEAVARQL